MLLTKQKSIAPISELSNVIHCILVAQKAAKTKVNFCCKSSKNVQKMNYLLLCKETKQINGLIFLHESN